MIPAPPASDALEHQHRRLVNLFTFIARAAHAGDTVQTDLVWEVAVAALERHLAYEEQRFSTLEALTSEQSEALRALRADHQRIRACLGELCVRLPVRAPSHGTLAELVAAVRTHAIREETTFFRWLEPPVPACAELPGSPSA